MTGFLAPRTKRTCRQTGNMDRIEGGIISLKPVKPMQPQYGTRVKKG